MDAKELLSLAEKAEFDRTIKIGETFTFFYKTVKTGDDTAEQSVIFDNLGVLTGSVNIRTARVVHGQGKVAVDFTIDEIEIEPQVSDISGDRPGLGLVMYARLGKKTWASVGRVKTTYDDEGYPSGSVAFSDWHKTDPKKESRDEFIARVWQKSSNHPLTLDQKNLAMIRFTVHNFSTFQKQLKKAA